MELYNLSAQLVNNRRAELLSDTSFGNWWLLIIRYLMHCPNNEYLKKELVTRIHTNSIWQILPKDSLLFVSSMCLSVCNSMFGCQFITLCFSENCVFICINFYYLLTCVVTLYQYVFFCNFSCLYMHLHVYLCTLSICFSFLQAFSSYRLYSQDTTILFSLRPY